MLLVPCFSQAQTSLYRHPAALGLHHQLHEFKGRTDLHGTNAMDAGLGLDYLTGIARQLDAAVGVSASFPDSIAKNTSGKKQLFCSVDASIRYRLLKADRWAQPYLKAGIGAGIYQQQWRPFFLIGPGLQLNYKDVFFLLNAQYHISPGNTLNSHFLYSIGIAGIIGHKKHIAPTSKVLQTTSGPLPPGDRDRDGIIDSLDHCPDQPGMVRYQGCPDKDGDGIIDPEDHCPDTYGLPRYQGCPVPDRDQDGINDELDKCPDLPGVLKYQGCPVPDKDHDGVPDEADSCIAIPGLVQNNGCPLVPAPLQEELNTAARNIQFATGRYQLLPGSLGSLNKVYRLLQQHQEWTLIIEGHTDNVGIAAANQLLSQQRANTVRSYLFNKGIAAKRLKAIGYGASRPLASNETTAGRAINRRVAFIVQY